MIQVKARCLSLYGLVANQVNSLFVWVGLLCLIYFDMEFIVVKEGVF